MFFYILLAIIIYCIYLYTKKIQENLTPYRLDTIRNDRIKKELRNKYNVEIIQYGLKPDTEYKLPVKKVDKVKSNFQDKPYSSLNDANTVFDDNDVNDSMNTFMEHQKNLNQLRRFQVPVDFTPNDNDQVINPMNRVF